MNKIKHWAKLALKKDYRWWYYAQNGRYDELDDKTYIERQYYARFAGKKILNLKEPHSLTEKLNWLKLYDRKPYYTQMVDKCAVKKYVSEIIGESYVIPLLGVWDDPEKIDHDSLPDQFVLKCTHDSGSILICKNKYEFDWDQATKYLKQKLAHSHYKENREWVYKNVKPRVIAEAYIDSLGKPESVEYKITCFNGMAKFTTVCTGIAHGELDIRTNDHFDRDWNNLPFYAIYKNSGKKIARPKEMDDMIKFSEMLSKDIPYLRVDWYLDDGRILFGEMTFYTWAGYMQFVPDSWDIKLGSWLKLPDKITE